MPSPLSSPLLASAADPASTAGAWEPSTWFEAFSTSPAFAGLMAAVAAGIALWGVNERVEADKKIARKVRRSERATAELMRAAAV